MTTTRRSVRKVTVSNEPVRDVSECGLIAVECNFSECEFRVPVTHKCTDLFLEHFLEFHVVFWEFNILARPSTKPPLRRRFGFEDTDLDFVALLCEQKKALAERRHRWHHIKSDVTVFRHLAVLIEATGETVYVCSFCCHSSDSLEDVKRHTILTHVSFPRLSEIQPSRSIRKKW
jgi:hypothetical protein